MSVTNWKWVLFNEKSMVEVQFFKKSNKKLKKNSSYDDKILTFWS